MSTKPGEVHSRLQVIVILRLEKVLNNDAKQAPK